MRVDGKEVVEIRSRDYWVKIVDFLQQNWALIAPCEKGCIVYFIHDLSGVFDQMAFPSEMLAEIALRKNGFRRFNEETMKNPYMKTYIAVPLPPFVKSLHPNGKIYSSGRFWR